MDVLWQDVIVSIVAVGAGAWLIRRRMRRGKAGCGDCPTAEAKAPAPTAKFVPLGALRKTRH